MDDNTILDQLEELARSLSIDVRFEQINKQGSFFPGGLCKFKGENILIINSKATKRDKIQALAKAVTRLRYPSSSLILCFGCWAIYSSTSVGSCSFLLSTLACKMARHVSKSGGWISTRRPHSKRDFNRSSNLGTDLGGRLLAKTIWRF